jgi:pimeloyl-ACP methyl ester carboxylesterase
MLAWCLPAVIAAGCGGAGKTPGGRPPSVREGYVTADDGVRIFYHMVGDGPGVVVIPMDVYLRPLLAPLAEGRRVVFYDPRNRGRSQRADLATVSLDRQVLDLEQLRAGLGLETMALLGWSGLGMEMAVYAIRHPERVTRLVQVDAVPPRWNQMQEQGGDGRDDRMDRKAVDALERRWKAGEFKDKPAEFCRQYNALTVPSNFADPAQAARVPDVCVHENEWPDHLWPYFGKLLSSFGEYDWRPDLARLDVPRLVIHGREDGIPLAGAEAWARGFPAARLIVLSPAGHFPFVERPETFFPAVDKFLDGDWPEEAAQVP